VRCWARAATPLLSFGLAGGLDPSLRAGALLNASAILTAEQASLPCSDALRTLLECELGDDVRHDALLYGAEVPVVSHAHKRALHERLAVLAVDMESAAIGRVARGRDVPFAALRCVVDPSDFSLPRAALVGMAEDGGNRPLASAAALLRRPWELPGPDPACTVVRWRPACPAQCGGTLVQSSAVMPRRATQHQESRDA
jgi:adenosylhomocysteine nucleosidase